MRPFTRRRLIGTAAAASVPAALAGVTPAFAQATDETDTLSDLVELEQGMELAYALAAQDGPLSPDTKMRFEEYGLFCGEHATAFDEALDQLAVDAPKSSDEIDDYDSLDGFDPEADETELVEFVIGLEEKIISAYEKQVPEIKQADLQRSIAQVAASHAQVLVALRVLAKTKGDIAKLPPASTSATASDPKDSDSD